MLVNETLRMVLTEGLRAYSDLAQGDSDACRAKLVLMRRDLEKFLDASNGKEMDSEYVVFESVCVPFYDTVVGYLAKYHPDMIDLLSDPIADTRRDAILLSRECKREGLEVHRVDAPQIFQDEGIASLNSYPVELLKRRFG